MRRRQRAPDPAAPAPATGLPVAQSLRPVKARVAPRPIMTRPLVPPRKLQAAGRAGEPGARRSGGQGPGAVADQRYAREDGPQHDDLQRHVTGRAVDELRQDRREEDRRLGVRPADEEAIQRDPPDRLALDRGSEGGDQRSPVPDRLHAEVKQVRRAGQLERREHEHRSLNQGTDTERDRQDLHVLARRVPQDGGHPGGPAQAKRPAEHEQHARPGDHDDHERGDGERQEMRRGQHEDRA